MRITRPLIATLLLLLSANLWASPQKCPSATGTLPASITGTLEYHPGVYGWYGVRLHRPLCGHKIIQLGLEDSAAFRQTHRFVGCQLTVKGSLFVPATGYWSATFGLMVTSLQPSKSCTLGKALPDYSAIPISPRLQRYKVIASYDPQTEIFSAKAYEVASQKLLSPWQTYATDSGNGGRDLQRMLCANGFLASDPAAIAPTNLQVSVDPDLPQAIDALIGGDSPVRVSFNCTRDTGASK